jgi:hypothetical protein
MPGWVPDWFADWSKAVSLFDILIWVFGVVAVIFVVRWVVRKGWPWLMGFAKAIINTAQIIDSVKDLPDFIERTDKTLEAQDTKIGEIHHEVHYNNGSSVKDAVHRVETGVSGLYDVVAEVRADVDKLKTDLVADVVPEQVKNDVG